MARNGWGLFLALALGCSPAGGSNADATGGATAHGWPSELGLERAVGELDPAYAPREAIDGARLAPPTGPTVHVATDGATVSLGGHEVGVSIASLGRLGRPVPLRDSPPRVAGVEVRRERAPGVSEWWRALPSGLEHGATLTRRPAGDGPLVLEVEVDGLTPRALSESAVALVEPGLDEPVALYAGLVVIAADGARVPARMAARGDHVRITIEDAEARYPLIVDPLVATEEAALLAPGAGALDTFGSAIALSEDGTRALVGSPLDDTPSGGDSGSAHVFVRTGSSWTLEQTLSGPGLLGGQHGASVALSADGSRAVVGAPANDTGATGSATVYARTGSMWTAEATLTPSDAVANDRIGFSVAMSEDGSRVLVGAPFDDTVTGSSVGSARVFARTGTSWSEEATLLASDGLAGDQLGTVVALSPDGTRALVAAPFDDTGAGGDAGTVRVFVRAGTSWSEEATLAASSAGAGDRFGSALGIDDDGDLALVGAPRADTTAGGNAGTVTVLTRSGSTWSEEAVLRASGAAPGDGFGNALALTPDGSRALVGVAADTYSGGGAGAGTARLFARAGTTWTEELTLFAASAAGGDGFGSSVALSADASRALVGAAGDDTIAGSNAGSARVLRVEQLTANGLTCSAAGECVSGFCVDGVCCESACGGGDTGDCQACSVAAGGTADGACGALGATAAAAIVCRPSAGVCDLAETCSETSTACPADAFEPTSTECRAAAGVCDLAERCTGAAADCPEDARVAAATVCRAAVGECDVDDACDGASVDCPTDAAQPEGTACGPAATAVCDAVDSCVGTVGASATCEARFAAAGTACSAGSCSLGVETLASSCDGASISCPVAETRACAPFTCRAGTCLAECTSNLDCVVHHECVEGACVPVPDAGMPDAAIAEDGGIDDAGASVDAGDGTGNIGGCGCATPGGGERRPGAPGLGALLALALAHVAARRRR